MSSEEPTVTVAVGDAELEIPEALVSTGQGIDSPSQSFQGGGMTVVVDSGPFADSLSSLAGRPGYEERSEELSGLPATTVFYREPDAGYTVAAHVPGLNRLTVVVRADDSVPPDRARRVISSIRRIPNSGRKTNGGQAT